MLLQLKRGRFIACAAALAIAFAAAATAHADMPNDPGFAGCEKQDQVTGCKDSEQWDLFGPLQGNTCPASVTGLPLLPHPDGGLPCWAPLATDPDHAAGVDMTGAWDQGNLGRDDVLVAYIEGGVNYSSDSIKDGLDNVYLNKGELPFPAGASRYDADGNGRFDIRDYANDPRVNPPCPSGVAPFAKFEEGTTRSCVPGGQHQYLNSVNIGGTKTPYLSPEDLIAVFGHCRISNGKLGDCPAGGRFDNDGNGYPNDVSGWNFQRNTNDPQTEDLGYNHAPGLISLIGGEANNNYAGVGVCRNCRVVPIKQGPECLGRTDKWGESILYATDLGALAISSVVVGFDYSSFNQAAIDYAYDHGVVMSLDSNDFDSMDHTDGMLWNHVMPGNSLFEDKGGPAANLTTYFRARSNVTSYGTHNIFSGGEESTSGATPFNASMYAMTASAGLNARDAHVISDRLNPNEIKQVLMDTASPVIPQTQTNTTVQQWPGNPDSHTDADHTNWSTQYGYGRPDLGAATKMIMDGHIPPTADITSPRWYQYVDPVAQPKLDVDGSLAPSRFHSGGSATYVLEYAPGANPKDSDFVTASQGTVSGPKTGLLGQLDLTKLPANFASHDPGSTLQPDGAEQYTVTIRLRVKDANGIKAEDRRSIGVRHDPGLMPGYPKYVGSEAGFGLTYTALEGRHELDLVFGTYDGVVHALRPNGTEAKGFPVRTRMLRTLDPREPQNSSAPAYRVRAFRDMRDPVAGIAVGDLFHDGREEVVASSTNGFVYAWGPNGKRLKGFPQHTNPAYWTLPVPTPRAGTPHSRLPDRGNTAPPALAPLERGGRLDIVQSSWDGHVYAWRPDGKPVPGWPVEVKLPQPDFQRDGVDPSKFIRDPKLMYPVGVADVLHTGHPQVFVSSFDCNGQSTSEENIGLALVGFNQSSDNAKTWMYGIWPDGTRHRGGAYLPNWPVAIPTLDFCYDQSIDFVGESTSPPEFADFDGSGKLRIVTAGVTGLAYVLNGDGSTYKTLDASCNTSACGPNPPYRPTGDTHTLTLTGQGGLGDIDGSGHPEFVQSQVGLESILSALSIPGLASLPQVYEKAWNVSTGHELSGFPRTQDGFPFYNSPIISDVAGDGTRQAIESNDNYWIHAYDSRGGEAPGFPKYTGQWPTFAGAVADPKLDGQLHYVTVTREGYLFDWKVGGRSSLNDQWWHYRHDERNTGLYGLDTRPPAPIGGLKVKSVHAHGHGRRAARRLVLSFVAPGDDWNVGRASRYEVRFSKHRIRATNLGRFRVTRSAPRPAPAGARQKFTIPRGLRGKRYYVAIRSIDNAGNISQTVVMRLRVRKHRHRHR